MNPFTEPDDADGGGAAASIDWKPHEHDGARRTGPGASRPAERPRHHQFRAGFQMGAGVGGRARSSRAGVPGSSHQRPQEGLFGFRRPVPGPDAGVPGLRYRLPRHPAHAGHDAGDGEADRGPRTQRCTRCPAGAHPGDAGDHHGAVPRLRLHPPLGGRRPPQRCGIHSVPRQPQCPVPGQVSPGLRPRPGGAGGAPDGPLHRVRGPDRPDQHRQRQGPPPRPPHRHGRLPGPDGGSLLPGEMPRQALSRVRPRRRGGLAGALGTGHREIPLGPRPAAADAGLLPPDLRAPPGERVRRRVPPHGRGLRRPKPVHGRDRAQPLVPRAGPGRRALAAAAPASPLRAGPTPWSASGAWWPSASGT